MEVVTRNENEPITTILEDGVTGSSAPSLVGRAVNIVATVLRQKQGDVKGSNENDN